MRGRRGSVHLTARRQVALWLGTAALVLLAWAIKGPPLPEPRQARAAQVTSAAYADQPRNMLRDQQAAYSMTVQRARLRTILAGVVIALGGLTWLRLGVASLWRLGRRSQAVRRAAYGERSRLRRTQPSRATKVRAPILGLTPAARGALQAGQMGLLNVPRLQGPPYKIVVQDVGSTWMAISSPRVGGISLPLRPGSEAEISLNNGDITYHFRSRVLYRLAGAVPVLVVGLPERVERRAEKPQAPTPLRLQAEHARAPDTPRAPVAWKRGWVADLSAEEVVLLTANAYPHGAPVLVRVASQVSGAEQPWMSCRVTRVRVAQTEPLRYRVHLSVDRSGRRVARALVHSVSLRATPAEEAASTG